MPRKIYTAGEAARMLGISLDTLRRWDRQGKIRTERDRANRRLVPPPAIKRPRGTRRARPRRRGLRRWKRRQADRVRGLVADRGVPQARSKRRLRLRRLRRP